MSFLSGYRFFVAAGLVALAACGPDQPTQPVAAPGRPAPSMAKAAVAAPPLQFGRYRVEYDSEGYASVLYQPQPDHDWVAIEQVTGQLAELDTANVDQAGEPELLLTVEYKRAGGSGASEGTVRTLHILRVGFTVDSLLTVRVGCSNYYHDWENGEVISFAQTQAVRAGYGFVQVGPVQTTYELDRPAQPCACNSLDLQQSGGAAFARPGRYRWRRGRLARVSPR